MKYNLNLTDKNKYKASLTSECGSFTLSPQGPSYNLQFSLLNRFDAVFRTPGLQGPPGPPGSSVKAGLVDGGDFSGSPKKFTVVLTTDMDDENYAILITGTDSRSYTYENKTVSGFVINANAAHVIAGEVSWIATPVGE